MKNVLKSVKIETCSSSTTVMFILPPILCLAAIFLSINPTWQSIKIDFGKLFDKSITIDINHVNVIDCVD